MKLNLEVVQELRDNVYFMNREGIPARAAWILKDFGERMGGFRDRERSMIFSILWALAVRHCGEGADPQVAFMEIPVPDDRVLLHEWFSMDVRNMDALDYAMKRMVGAHMNDGISLLRWVQSNVFCVMGDALLKAIEAYQPPAPKKMTKRERELELYRTARIASDHRQDFYLCRKYLYKNEPQTEQINGENGSSWMEVYEVGTDFNAVGDGALYYVGDENMEPIRPARYEMRDLADYIAKCADPTNPLLSWAERTALEVMK